MDIGKRPRNTQIQIEKPVVETSLSPKKANPAAPPQGAPPKRRRWPLLVFLAFTASILIGLAAMIGWYNWALQPRDSVNNTSQLVPLNEGENSVELAAELSRRELIRSALAFRVYVRLHGVANELQAGVYRLSPNQRVAVMTQKFVSGDTAAVRVTIRGGMTLAQVSELLVQKGYKQSDIAAALSAEYDYSVLADKPANANLEGYLFPDTYFIDQGKPVSLLINAMLANTDKKVTPTIRASWAARGLNIYQGLTLASIVEKEAATLADRRQVAQVFYKRLAIGKKLESDVTFQYGAKLLGVEASTTVDSPYNTYLYGGLPPGPICMPDAIALESVAQPASGEWLFFIADRQGNVHFALDEEKHNQNIEKYLQ